MALQFALLMENVFVRKVTEESCAKIVISTITTMSSMEQKETLTFILEMEQNVLVSFLNAPTKYIFCNVNINDVTSSRAAAAT